MHCDISKNCGNFNSNIWSEKPCIACDSSTYELWLNLLLEIINIESWTYWINRCCDVWSSPQEGYSKWFGKISVCVSVCSTSLYCKNWTLLDFYTWHVYTPPKWQKRALTNIFSHYTRSYQKGQEKGEKVARCGFFQSSRLFLHLTKQEFYITGCLNDSSFQQSKLESLNMYTLKVIKLTIVSWNTPPLKKLIIKLFTIIISSR